MSDGPQADDKKGIPEDDLTIMVRREAWTASGLCCLAAIGAMYFIGRAQFSEMGTSLVKIEAKLDALVAKPAQWQQQQVHVEKAGQGLFEKTVEDLKARRIANDNVRRSIGIAGDAGSQVADGSGQD